MAGERARAETIEPQRAAVAPRVRVLPGGGAAQPLERVVRGLIESGARGPVLLRAPVGGGKTSALAHLRAVLPNELQTRIELLDEPQAERIATSRDSLAIVALPLELPGNWLLRLELAEWGEDDWIEYCAARRRECCAWVLSRLRADDGKDLLRGSPQLWHVALDRLAADETLADSAAALRQHVTSVLPDARARLEVGESSLRDLTDPEQPMRRAELPDELSDYAIALLRHRAVRVLLAAERICAELASGARVNHLDSALTPDLLRETATEVRKRPEAINRLDKLLAGSNRENDALAASIRLAADPFWHPTNGRGWNLCGAMLARATWAAVILRKANLSNANLHDADLTGSRLGDARARGTNFRHATLANAVMQRINASDANFACADLSGADAAEGVFSFADLTRANLRGADLTAATLVKTNLAGANLTGTILHRAELTDVNLEDAALIGTDLRRAKLSRVRLSAANVSGVCWRGAALLNCDLEGMRLPGADLRDVNFTGSYLTASFIPRGNFRAARLRDTGLAEIDWPGADLRGADLRGATFHMGSSRSGLVGSPIACEGSRTGFYTDEFTEQDYKAAEEIRKANLCGADLRGAIIDGVDFYLVDLRGAKCDADQAEHLARCGAILRSRAA